MGDREGQGATDARLVEATIGGDHAAYAELFERHAKAVRTTVRGHLRDPDGVDDVVQEVFARALQRVRTLRDPTRFRPWLLSIARNTATDMRRLETRIDREQIDEAGGDGLPLPEPGEGPDIQAELRDLSSMVREGVAGLSPRDATALSMVMWLGFGPRDVAAALGVSPGAAKVLLHRARNRLRDALIVKVAEAAPSFACSELTALLEANDDAAAVRHVTDCAECLEGGRVHLGLGAGAA